MRRAATCSSPMAIGDEPRDVVVVLDWASYLEAVERGRALAEGRPEILVALGSER